MDKLLANAIRFLSIDMVERAKSGHPGMPMGMADIATVLFKDFLKFNPQDPTWFNRDRLVISNGHGSALLYSCLYLAGFEKMTLEQLKNFRQLGSITAGHPEYDPECGIETSTGPLGQGLANSVGMALAERILNARFNDDLVNHYTYVFCGDGCLMEGISQEAISFAGHYKLNKLIVLFDDNNITIDGRTSLSTSDDQIHRFKASHWNAVEIDGHNHSQIRAAIAKAQTSDKPTLIACKTTIGFGSPNKAGSSSTHGSPLGEDEIKLTRKNLKWSYSPFEVPENILREWRAFHKRNKHNYESWVKSFKTKGSFLKDYLSKAALNKVTPAILNYIENTPSSANSEATRVSSGKVIELLHNIIPNLIGGSADLSGSNNTHVKEQKVISSKDYSGSYIHYGIREHAMAAIMNGLTLHGGLITYGGTFLMFSDYARPAIRLSALMKLPVIYIMTHDSIGLGEDGPTHQPIEHLASLRAMPNLNVFRPADSVEVAQCWELAISSSHTPSILALSRQSLSQLRTFSSTSNECKQGAYILKEAEHHLKVTLFASGSEVEIALVTAKMLESNSIGARVVSVPCVELLFQQDPEYIMMLTCNPSLKVAIEAASGLGWERLIGPHGIFIGMHGFGASGKSEDLYNHFGITAEHCYDKILKVLE